MRDEEEIEQRKVLILEMSGMTRYNVGWLIDVTKSYSFKQVQEVKACLIHGLSFDQSSSLVDLLALEQPNNRISVLNILRALK